VRDHNYVSSWVEEDLTKCFQVMETADRALLDDWRGRWQDIIDPAVRIDGRTGDVGDTLRQEMHDRVGELVVTSGPLPIPN
jgi:hypothetical protein